jgi:WXG100 family type VII secretion target
MAGYRVDLHRLADIVDQIGRFEQHLDTALADVDARVDKLHTTWTGDAATAHRQAHEEWQRGVAEMRAALAVMRSNARTAHGNYSSAVTTNADMWGQAR